jgi:hypothetical protein
VGEREVEGNFVVLLTFMLWRDVRSYGEQYPDHRNMMLLYGRTTGSRSETGAKECTNYYNSGLLMTASAATRRYKHESSLHTGVALNRVSQACASSAPCAGSSRWLGNKVPPFRAGKRVIYANMPTPYSSFQRSNLRNISGVICRLRVFAAAMNALCGT